MPRIVETYYDVAFAQERETYRQIIRTKIPENEIEFRQAGQWLDSEFPEVKIRSLVERRRALDRMKANGQPYCEGASTVAPLPPTPETPLSIERLAAAREWLFARNRSGDPLRILGSNIPKKDRYRNALRVLLVGMCVIDPDSEEYLGTFTELAKLPWGTAGEPEIGRVEVLKSWGYDVLDLVQESCEALGWCPRLPKRRFRALPELPRVMPSRALSGRETALLSAIQKCRKSVGVAIWSEVESIAPMTFLEVVDLVLDGFITISHLTRFDGEIRGFSEVEHRFAKSQLYVVEVSQGEAAKASYGLSLTEMGRSALHACVVPPKSTVKAGRQRKPRRARTPRVTQKQKAAVDVRDQGLTIQQICVQLGMNSESAVRGLIKRGRKNDHRVSLLMGGGGRSVKSQSCGSMNELDTGDRRSARTPSRNRAKADRAA